MIHIMTDRLLQSLIIKRSISEMLEWTKFANPEILPKAKVSAIARVPFNVEASLMPELSQLAPKGR